MPWRPFSSQCTLGGSAGFRQLIFFLVWTSLIYVCCTAHKCHRWQYILHFACTAEWLGTSCALGSGLDVRHCEAWQQQRWLKADLKFKKTQSPARPRNARSKTTNKKLCLLTRDRSSARERTVRPWHHNRQQFEWLCSIASGVGCWNIFIHSFTWTDCCTATSSSFLGCFVGDCIRHSIIKLKATVPGGIEEVWRIPSKARCRRQPEDALQAMHLACASSLA